MEYIIILITTTNTDEAKKICNSLVTKKLAACGNIVSPVHSIFQWKGELCKEEEALLILKSTAKNFQELEAEVKKLHSYETPEIIALPISAGSQQYLQWVADETK